MEQIRSSRRPTMNYREMGIMPGAVLSYVKDRSITVTVLNDKKVNYLGNEYFLTPITRQLTAIESLTLPAPYWEYEGRNLRAIYNDTYTLEE